MKHAIKVAVAHLLYGLGVLQVWQRYLLRKRAVVLMYHRVLDEQQWQTTGSHPGMAVRTTTFERQMALLRRRFVPLRLDAFVDHVIAKQPFPSSACLITFDDGWRDTMTNAWPVLRRHQLPLAVFLPSSFIGTRRLFIREAFTHLALRARDVAQDPQKGPALRRLLAAAGLERLLDLRGPGTRAAIIDSIGAAPVDASTEQLVAGLSDLLGVRPEALETPDRFMTWSEVDALARDGVAFGGHGADHRLLARLSAERADEDVRRSRAALDARGLSGTAAFSYPNGSCNDTVAAMVQSYGFQVAFTTQSGTVSCDDHPMFLRRVNIHEDMTSSAPMFLARVVGLF